MIDYQATNIVNAALNLDLRSKNGLEKFTQIVQTALSEAAQHSVQADEATCSAKYHLAFAEKGDTRCGVCGQPLHR